MDFNAVIFKYLGDSLTLVKNLLENLNKQSKKIEELEEKLRVNSQNSSKPPSTDFNKKKKKKKFHTKKSNNKPGGQPGHKGTNRKLEENPDSIINCNVDDYCSCGGAIIRETHICIHQVIEFRIEKGICNMCSLRHKGLLPDGFSYYCLGPNAISTIANLGSRFRLSRQKIVEFFKDFFDIKISKGTVSNHEKIISDAIKPWAWVGVSHNMTVFSFNKSRGKKAAQNLLGASFLGYLVSDRYSAYNFVSSDMRQICWAHLKRDIRKISERSGDPGRLGDQMLSTFYRIYSVVHTCKQKRIKTLEFIEKCVYNYFSNKSPPLLL